MSPSCSVSPSHALLVPRVGQPVFRQPPARPSVRPPIRGTLGRLRRLGRRPRAHRCRPLSPRGPPSLRRSDASLYCDDVDIRFSKTMNSCKVLQIRYASVGRLLERLTDLRFLSIDFLNTFLHSYRVFTTAVVVLDKLITIYRKPISAIPARWAGTSSSRRAPGAFQAGREAGLGVQAVAEAATGVRGRGGNAGAPGTSQPSAQGRGGLSGPGPAVCPSARGLLGWGGVSGVHAALSPSTGLPCLPISERRGGGGREDTERGRDLSPSLPEPHPAVERGGTPSGTRGLAWGRQATWP